MSGRCSKETQGRCLLEVGDQIVVPVLGINPIPGTALLQNKQGAVPKPTCPDVLPDGHAVFVLLGTHGDGQTVLVGLLVLAGVAHEWKNWERGKKERE